MPKDKDRRDIYRMLIVFGLAFILRLIYLLQQRTADPLFDYPILDGLYHHNWAVSIVQGAFLGRESFFRAPLYPYFLALIYKIFGIGFFMPRVVQSLLGSISCVLTYRLGRAILGENVGLIAGLIAAAYPLSIYYENELLIPALLIFLILTAVQATRWAAARPAAKTRWLAAGIAWGLAAITRPNVLLSVASLPVWLVRKCRRYLAAAAGLGLLSLVLVISPVTARNYLVSRELVLIAWQGGYNFYIGNNPKADGKTAIVPGTKKSWQGGYYDSKRLAEEALNKKLNNSEVDRYWFERGVTFILTQPGRALLLFLKKIYLWFGGVEISNNRDIYYFTRPTYLKYLLFKLPWFQFPFGLLLPLAVVGVYFGLRERRDISLILQFVATYTLSFLLFFVTARYRLTIVPFLIILAAFAARRLYDFFRARDYRSLRSWFVIFLPVLVFFNLNLTRIGDNPTLNRLLLANLELRKGNYRRALQYFEETLPQYRNDPEVLGQIGDCYYRLGRMAEAFKYFQQSLAIDQRQPVVYLNLGNIYYLNHDFATAEKAYRTAIAYDDNYALAYNNLGNAYYAQDSLKPARAAYTRALILNPNQTSALYYSGIIEYRAGNRAYAESLWQKVLALDPNNSAAIQALQRLRTGVK